MIDTVRDARAQSDAIDSLATSEKRDSLEINTGTSAGRTKGRALAAEKCLPL